jgi:hypothetical protein
MSEAQYEPLAGCMAISNPEAAPYHRRWLVVNTGGQWLSPEACPALRGIQVSLRFGFLVLTAPGMLRLDIPLEVIEDDDTVRYQVAVGQEGVAVIDEGELAAAWIGNITHVPCHIMKVHPDAPPVVWPDKG